MRCSQTLSGFFEESTKQSRVKATIVAEYFWAWVKVIIPTARKHSGRIAYVDLFAGPGRYVDGTKSTPLLVLEKAIADQQMREMLVTVSGGAQRVGVRETCGRSGDSVGDRPHDRNMR